MDWVAPWPPNMESSMHEVLKKFRRYARGTAESQRLCRDLIEDVRNRTGAIPQETVSNIKSDKTGNQRDEPPYLIYLPDDAPRFALIETINSRETGVVVSIYGDSKDHESADLSALRTAGKPRKSYSKIAIRSEQDLPAASRLLLRAYELKRKRVQARAGEN